MAVLAELVTFIRAGVTAVVAGTPRTAASVNAGLTDLASRTRFLKDRCYNLLFGDERAIESVDTALDRITITGHGLGANTAVQVFATNGGALPGGLALLTPYYVDVVDANTIKLSASSGPGAAVDLTAGFSGEVYIQAIPDLFATLMLSSATFGTGVLSSLVVFLAGAQAITGAKTISDLTVTGANNYKQASRSLTRMLDTAWVNETNNLGPTRAGVFIMAGGSGDDWSTPIDLPHGQTVTEVAITLDPTDVGSLPGGVPTIAFLKRHRDTGVETSIATGSDLSADFTAYSAIHSLATTAFSEVIDRNTYEYFVITAGSTGTTPANDVAAWGLRATCTCTSLTQWS